MRLRALVISAVTAGLAAGPGAGLEVTLRAAPEVFQGADGLGRPFLWTPDPVETGSSVSHWDLTAAPFLLMQPTILGGVAHHEVDVTSAVFRDLGWPEGEAQFNLFSLNNPQAGLNDPRQPPQAPGNPGTTLGEVRVAALERALAIWAAELGSAVPIDVFVQFRPLPCREGVGAALAAASSLYFFTDVPGLPTPGILYPAALAEALVAENLTGRPIDYGADLLINVNSEIDEGCVGGDFGFYYGLDGNPPARRWDFVSTMLHELAHGLGFANRTQERSGHRIGELPSIFDVFTLDTAVQKTWSEMTTDKDRRLSAVRTRQVVWNGPAVTARAPEVLAKGTSLLVGDLGEGARSLVIRPATFGPSLDPVGLTGELACVVDHPSPSPLDGCSPPAEASLAGRIALVDRGLCTFAQKAHHAEAAGAVAVVVVDLASDAPVTPAGTGEVSIPVVAVGRTDGRRLREQACPGVESEAPAPGPPSEEWLESPSVPGFRFQVRLGAEGESPVTGVQESDCQPETLCVSGALAGRSEVFLRMIGPRPNGFLWPTVVRFTPSQVEIWVQQTTTGDLRYYSLPAVPPGVADLSGLQDRAGFTPTN